MATESSPPGMDCTTVAGEATIFKIYFLRDPQTNEVRYVGQTIREIPTRLGEHYSDKKRTRKSNWILSLRRKGLRPFIEIVNFCYSKSESDECEIGYIKFLRSIGVKLTNLTNGGEGTFGYVPSKETLKKLSDSHKGHIQSQETKDKRAVALTGKKRSEEYKNKMRIMAIDRKWQPPSETNNYWLGKKRSPEDIEKLAAKLRGRKIGPHSKERIEKITLTRIRKPVIQFSLNGEEIKRWPSLLSTRKEGGFHEGHIIEVCNGKSKQHKGYIWKYEDTNK